MTRHAKPTIPFYRELAHPQCGVEAGGWRPIETAPKDGTVIDVLVEYSLDGKRISCQREADVTFEAGEWLAPNGYAVEWGPDEYGQKATVTHWMPLPAPPAGGRE